MKNTQWRVLLCLTIAGTFAACAEETDDSPEQMASVETIAPGDTCEAGGAMVRYGVDSDGDRVISEAEANDTVTVCNGEAGASGADGENGTDGTNGTDGVDGADGADGFTSLVNVTDEPAGANCEAGGEKFDVGLDNGDGDETPNDGILGAGEIDATAYLCDGVDGQDGANAAAALVSVSLEPAGANCADGGQRIDIGFDTGSGGETAGDGVLGAGEISRSSYVCNGATGATGTQGERGFSSLVRIFAEPVGVNCLAAGQRIQTGLDNGDGGETPSDGLLGAGEVDDTSYVCNGEDGLDAFTALARTVTATVAECANGGSRIEIGLDNGDGGEAARDGSLGAGEIDSTSVVCNGADGATGATGSTGDAGFNSLVAISPVSAGVLCANGGQQLDTGLDNGDGAGTPRNGTLEAGEIDSTTLVCNGVDGVDGLNGTDGTNGTNGTNGTDGFTTLVSLTTLSAGGVCANGGQQISTGLDNGDGGGAARNGALEAGEIDTTRNVCNGIDGVDGTNGTDGINGTDGADGADGGKTVVDANGRVLGELDATSSNGVAIVSSTGYFYYVGWDGTFYASQTWHQNAGCTGTVWLNSGSASPSEYYGRFIIYSGADSSFKVVANVGSSGTATSTAGFSVGAIYNNGSGCSDYAPGSTGNGWELNTISAADAGIPTTITPPLTIQ